LVNELGPNAFGEPVEPGRVDCYLGLPLRADEDEDGPGGVLVVAARWLLHPTVPSGRQPDPRTGDGHLDRQAGELVFPADLTQEPRPWPADTWTALGADLQQVAAGWLAAGSAARYVA
jgi:hypothetical protein